MTIVNLILGKREREPIERIKTDTYPHRYSRSEIGEGTENFPYRTGKGQASYKTDRDFQQAVGKLYTGTVDDDDILQQKQNESGPRLVKKRIPREINKEWRKYDFMER